jgi:hypothetical protein
MYLLSDFVTSELEHFQYVFLQDTTVHFVTLNAGIAPFEEAVPIFEQMAETFSFEDVESVESTPVPTSDQPQDDEWVEYSGNDLSLRVPPSWIPLDASTDLDAF